MQEKLVTSCERFALWIANIWFKNQQKLYACRAPGDTGRYQIDKCNLFVA